MRSYRRILSFVLALTMMISTFVFTASSVDTTKYTPQDGVIIFNSQTVVDQFIKAASHCGASNGVKYSYDAKEDALKVEVTGSDPWIYVNCYDNIGSKKFNGNNINYFYTVYKAPQSNSTASKTTECKVYLSTAQTPTPSEDWMCRWAFTPISSNQYVIARMDVGSRLSGRGNFYGFRYDFFQNAQVGDVIYIDSIILNNSKIPGVEIAGARTAIQNGYPIDPDSIYLCRAYDTLKYTSPLWKGNVVYNEAVCPVENSDGSYTYTLMYEPDDILYVYDGTFSSYYTEGVDFKVSGNKLTILPGGSINKFTRDNAYGGHIYFEGYLNVTYTHSDTWDYYVPQSKTSDLPRTAAAIKNNTSYNVVFFGDSIAGGAEASSYRGYYPNAPFWWAQIEDLLRESYGFTNMNVYDISEGGETASGMVNRFKSDVLSKNPDLVFIEFGVNDAQNDATSGYKSALKSMITAARNQNPNCEIVLVSPFYSNTNNYSDSGFEVCQQACLQLEKEYTGVVCADITAMHKSLRQVKRHYDITGDNVCHPNDFFSRVYAQVCLATIIPDELGYEAYPYVEQTPLEINSITPASASISKTGSVTFVADVTGEGVSYNWNTSSLPAGVTVSGATTNTLKVTVSNAMSGSFAKDITLTVTDANGKTASKSVKLNYTGIIPVQLSSITPASATITETGSVSFKANAMGEGITYKWDTSALPAGVTVSGATSSTLKVTVSNAMTGDFTSSITLTVTDSLGNTAQKSVQLSYKGLILGDIFDNGDNAIDAKDVFRMKLIAKKAVTATEKEKTVADIDRDGDVDITDLFYLKMRIRNGKWTIKG